MTSTRTAINRMKSGHLMSEDNLLDPRWASLASMQITEAIKRSAGIVVVENLAGHGEDELRQVLAELGYYDTTGASS